MKIKIYIGEKWKEPVLGTAGRWPIMPAYAESKAAIEAALAKVNGESYASAHYSGAFTELEEIQELAETAEKDLEQRGIPKKLRNRCGLDYIGRGLTGAHSYSGTRIQLFRGSKDWFLTGAAREEVQPRRAESFVLQITPAARDAAIEAALANCVIVD